MDFSTINPFDTIEAAQEYLALLSESIAENRQRIEADIMEVTNQNSQGCCELLRLVFYNLDMLEKHLKASHKTLNNLRKLRRLISSTSAANATIEQQASEMSGIEAA